MVCYGVILPLVQLGIFLCSDLCGNNNIILMNTTKGNTRTHQGTKIEPQHVQVVGQNEIPLSLNANGP